MSGQIENTLRSLTPPFQRHVTIEDYEIVLIDNGSPEPLPRESWAIAPNIRYEYIPPERANPCPAAALNWGVATTHAPFVCLMIDGARMVTPGVLHWSLKMARMCHRCVVEVRGWHLGAEGSDLLGKGRVIGLDVSHETIAERARSHPRITFIEGDACQSFATIRRMIPKEQRALVIEDSSHTYENTLNVLRTFSELIHPGDYIIVEDGICHHGLDVGPRPGPYEAVETFVQENADFAIDRDRESFLITWNPKGYLRRKSNKEM